MPEQLPGLDTHLAALHAGTNGFLSKTVSPDELVAGITEVVAGGGAALIGHMTDRPPTRAGHSSPGTSADRGMFSASQIGRAVTVMMGPCMSETSTSNRTLPDGSTSCPVAPAR
jgi:hypothetical protein